MDVVSGAHRQKKLRRYEVTLYREVEYVAVHQVLARSAEEAVGIAENVIGNSSSAWTEGETRSYNPVAKVVRP